jgi:hypothetical protein
MATGAAVRRVRGEIDTCAAAVGRLLPEGARAAPLGTDAAARTRYAARATIRRIRFEIDTSTGALCQRTGALSLAGAKQAHHAPGTRLAAPAAVTRISVRVSASTIAGNAEQAIAGVRSRVGSRIPRQHGCRIGVQRNFAVAHISLVAEGIRRRRIIEGLPRGLVQEERSPPTANADNARRDDVEREGKTMV